MLSPSRCLLDAQAHPDAQRTHMRSPPRCAFRLVRLDAQPASMFTACLPRCSSHAHCSQSLPRLQSARQQNRRSTSEGAPPKMLTQHGAAYLHLPWSTRQQPRTRISQIPEPTAFLNGVAQVPAIIIGLPKSTTVPPSLKHYVF